MCIMSIICIFLNRLASSQSPENSRVFPGRPIYRAKIRFFDFFRVSASACYVVRCVGRAGVRAFYGLFIWAVAWAGFVCFDLIVFFSWRSGRSGRSGGERAEVAEVERAEGRHAIFRAALLFFLSGVGL